MMLLFNIQQREWIQTSLPSHMWFTRQKHKPTSIKEPISECYTGTYSCSHAMYSWNWYGRFSEIQCHWRLSVRQNMSHFALPTIGYLKASPDTASLIFRSKLTWRKLENIYNQPIITPTMKTNVELIMITRWSKSTQGIWLHPYTVTQAKLVPDLVCQGHLRSENDAIMTLLRLIPTSDLFIHPC